MRNANVPLMSGLSSSESDILKLEVGQGRRGRCCCWGEKSCARAPQVLSDVTRFQAAGLELKNFARACPQEKTKWKVGRWKIEEKILNSICRKIEGILECLSLKSGCIEHERKDQTKY
jgi:hypothetical protein